MMDMKRYLNFVYSDYEKKENVAYMCFNQGLFEKCSFDNDKILEIADKDYETLLHYSSYCGFDMSQTLYKKIKEYKNFLFWKDNFEIIDETHPDYIDLPKELGQSVEQWQETATLLGIDLSQLLYLYHLQLSKDEYSYLNKYQSIENDFRVEKYLKKIHSQEKDELVGELVKYKVGLLDKVDTEIFNDIYKCNVDFVFPEGWVVNGKTIYWAIVTDELFKRENYPAPVELEGMIFHINGFIGSGDEMHVSLKYGSSSSLDLLYNLLSAQDRMSIYRDYTLVEPLIMQKSSEPIFKNKANKSFTFTFENTPFKYKSRNLFDYIKNNSLFNIYSLIKKKPSNKIDEKHINKIFPRKKLKYDKTPKFNSISLDVMFVRFCYEDNASIEKFCQEIGIYYGNYCMKMGKLKGMNDNQIIRDYFLHMKKDFYYETLLYYLFKENNVEMISDSEIKEFQSITTPDFLFKNYILYNGRKTYWMEIKPNLKINPTDQLVRYIIAFGPGILYLEKQVPKEKIEKLYSDINTELLNMNIDIDLNDYLFIYIGDYLPEIIQPF